MRSAASRIIPVASGGLLFSCAYAVLMAAFPSELTSKGVSSERIGLVIGTYALGALVFRFALLRVVDQIGARHSAWLAVLAGSCATLVAGAALSTYEFPPLWILATSRLLHGAATACFFTAGVTFISHAGPEGKRGARIGLYVGLFGLAALLAPSVGYLLWVANLKIVLWLLPPLFVIAAAFLMPDDHRALVPRGEATNVGTPQTAVIWPALFASFVAISVQGSAEAHLPKLVSGTGGRWLLILLYVAFGIGLAIGQIIGGRVSDRLGRKPMTVMGLLLLCVATALPLFQLSAGMLMTSAPLLGLGGGMVNSATMAHLGDVASGGAFSGATFGLAGLIAELGMVFGAVSGGVVISTAGAPGYFRFGVGMAALTLPVTLRTWPSR